MGLKYAFAILIALVGTGGAVSRAEIAPEYILCGVTSLQTNIPLTSSQKWVYGANPIPLLDATDSRRAMVKGSTATATVVVANTFGPIEVWVEGTYDNVTVTSNHVTFQGDGYQDVTLQGIPNYVNVGSLQLTVKSNWINSRYVKFAPYPKNYSLYVTYASPLAPLATDWTDLLDITCSAAKGKSDPAQIADAVTQGVNGIQNALYSPAGAQYYTNAGSFSLKTFFLASSRIVECRDMAGLLQLAFCSQGISSNIKRLSTNASGFYTNPCSPVGMLQSQYFFSYHAVTTYGGNFYDACLKMYKDPSNGADYNKAPAGWNAQTYWQVIGTAGAIWGLAFCVTYQNGGILTYQPVPLVQDSPALAPVTTLS